MPKSRGGGGAKVVQQQPQRPRNLHRYKTELCRAWGENRNCKYGDKCQVSTPLAFVFSFCFHQIFASLKNDDTGPLRRVRVHYTACWRLNCPHWRRVHRYTATPGACCP